MLHCAVPVRAGSLRLVGPHRPRVGPQGARIVAVVGRHLLVFALLQHGQRHVEILVLGTDVVWRMETTVLLHLEVVVDEAGPDEAPEHEPDHGGAHDHVEASSGFRHWPRLLSACAALGVPGLAMSRLEAGGLATLAPS